MTFATVRRRTAFGLALIAPLGIAACSSGGSSASGSSSSASNAAADAQAAQAAQSEAATRTPISKKTSKNAEMNKGEQVVAPGTGAPSTTLQPIEGGAAASAGETDALQGLVDGVYKQSDLRSFLDYVPSNTCDRVVEDQKARGEYHDVSSVPNMPTSSLPGYSRSHVEPIQDVKVDGDRASATVTSVTQDGPQTSTMRFHKENEKWKFCN